MGFQDGQEGVLIELDNTSVMITGDFAKQDIPQLALALSPGG